MVSVILVNPQMGENIGAAARAMQNFGLSDLRLVSPRDGWPNENAAAMSAGALERMPPVQVFDTLGEALADLHYSFATTARQRDMVKPVFTPSQAAELYHTKIQKKQAVGLVFGAERTGLLNNEISLCSAVINIPTNPDFSSLNLGQSVLLMAYEIMNSNTRDLPIQDLDMGDSFPAKQRDVLHFLTRLEQDLDERSFFRAEGLKPTMVRNIQNIFTRAELTDQELRTLQGVLSALRGNKKQK